MHLLTFILLGIPVTVLIYLVSCALVGQLDGIIEISNKAYHYFPAGCDIGKVIFLCGVTPFLLQLIALLDDIFAKANTNSKLVSNYERRKNSKFERFYFPTLKELVKLSIITYLARPHTRFDDIIDTADESPYKWSILQLNLGVFIYSMAKFLITCWVYSPFQYKKNYSKFSELYDMWMDHEVASVNDKTDAAIVLADSMVKYSSISSNPDSPLNDKFPIRIDRNSVETTNTLYSDQIPFPPKFNLSSFNDSSLTGKGSLNKIQSMPIMSKSDSCLSNSDQNSNQLSKKLNSNFKSCYHLVDKLYSISPKNTYHLNYATACAVSKQDSSLDSDNESINFNDYNVETYEGPDFDGNSPFIAEGSDHLGGGGGGGNNYKIKLPNGTKIGFGAGGGGGLDYDHNSDNDEEIDDNSPKSSDHFGGGGGGGTNFKIKLPNGTKIGGGAGGGGGFDYDHNNGDNQDYGSCENQLFKRESKKYKKKIIGFINWFQWLNPLLPIASDEELQSLLASPTPKRNKRDPTDPVIKKKLSLYTLRKRSIPDDSFSFNSNVTCNSMGNIDSCFDDLESNCKKINSSSVCNNRQNYDRFEQYVLTYFDYDLHTFKAPFEVDPFFKNFDYVCKDFNCIYFIIVNLNCFFWDSIGFMAYSLPYLIVSINHFNLFLMFLGIMMVKFFNLNYLNDQFAKSFKISIIYEVLINFTLFISLVYYYYSII